jgi:hypothetical protein
MNIKSIAVACLALAVSACVTHPNQSLDASAKTNIKRIAVVEVRPAQNYSVNYIKSGAGVFGLVGGLVKASDLTAKSEQITTKIKENGNPDIANFITEGLVRGLREKGYVVTTVKPAYPATNAGTEKQATNQYAPVDADAVLEITLIAVGFWATSSLDDYQPTIRTSVTLTSARNGAVLYTERLTSGVDFDNSTIKKLDSDPKYSYKNFEALSNSLSQATDGLRAGATDIVKHVVAALR